MASRSLPILLILLVLGVVLKEPFLITLSSAVFVIIGAAWLWQNQALHHITYTRKVRYIRGFPGERIDLALEIENRKIMPVSWLRVQDHWDRAITPEEQSSVAPSHLPEKAYLTNIFSLRWYENARRNYSLLLRNRGIYTMGPARLDSGDLFGIFEKRTELQNSQYITVFPVVEPIEQYGFPAEDPFGDQRSKKRIFEDPNRPMGVREYRPEDGFRRIHWPATARTNQLQVKVFQPTTGQVMVVCLNVSTFEHHWEGINPELLEHLLRVAASIASEGLDQGFKVGLIANGCMAHADQPFRIPPGRSPGQRARLLEALAAVTTVTTSSFDRFLLREVPRIQYGATLVILTAITTPELAIALLQLKQHERHLTLFSIAPEAPPVIPGVRTIHQPFESPD